VKDQRIVLKVRTILNPDQPLCNAALTLWVNLSGFEVGYELNPVTTSSVSTFWSQELVELHLYMKRYPTPAEAHAALLLAALAGHLPSGHGVRIKTYPLEPEDELPSPPIEPFVRSVVIREAPSSEIRLVMQGNAAPLLLVRGKGPELINAIRIMGGQERSLLLSSIERVHADASRGVPRLQQLTFDAIGKPQIQMQGSGEMDSDIAFSQSDFERPVRSISLRLVGAYSPVPDGGTANLAILLNDGLVTALPFDRSGRFDTYVSFPGSLLRRDNRINLRILYTPPGGDCRLGAHNMIVRIDGGSYLEAKEGQSIDEGFERFPQVLFPSFDVSFDQRTIRSVENSARVVAALQRLSKTMLSFDVVPWDLNRRSNKALVAIASQNTSGSAIQPPLELTSFRVIDSDHRTLMQTENDAHFGVIQAFSQNGRDVLLLSDRMAPEKLGRLTELLSDGNGWFDLTGDIWIQGDDREPSLLRIRGSGLRIEPIAENGADWWWNRLRIYAMGISFAGIVAFLFFTYPRVVRKK
jgi:hypothetical protein